MGWKHAPGCGCCDDTCLGCATTLDLELPAGINQACCADIAGTYTLTRVTPENPICKWSTTVSNPTVCTNHDDLTITLEFFNHPTPTSAQISILFSGTEIAEETLIIHAGFGANSTISPTTWFTDGDCTATLTFTLSNDVPFIPVTTDPDCEFASGDDIVLNP